ncbi:PIG-L family deacetylase [Arachnia propionica]|uniref:PIG-L family deacetylase n=1 Tax=Arachnia propionica TaxID=1750 RepID=A0A3P1T331_9ACTN|nr:PIG-L deacetylase family protein [Arachnia propionica]MDO5084680.1 PIG-L deacetylase family protein [Arachnia propionica]RRD03704.1 PIG-L family deacetylase [Arachnia propionica]
MPDSFVPLVLISLHTLAVFLYALAKVSLSRRISQYRLLYRFVIVSAGVMIPANLACLSTPPGAVHTLIQSFSIASLAAIAALTWHFRHPSCRQDPSRIVLAIGAHPDDLELACSGTLARLVDNGHRVHALVMTHGAVGGDASIRPGEARNGARFLGLTSCELHDLPDTHLAESSNVMIGLIETAIARHHPDLILTHSANDQHQDHVAVHWATRRAARNHPAIICYESPSATPAFCPQAYVDVSGYLDTKQMAVELHRDQSEKPYMTTSVLQGVATFRGRQARMDDAEGFEVIRLPLFGGIL